MEDFWLVVMGLLLIITITLIIITDLFHVDHILISRRGGAANSCILSNDPADKDVPHTPPVNRLCLLDPSWHGEHPVVVLQEPTYAHITIIFIIDCP